MILAVGLQVAGVLFAVVALALWVSPYAGVLLVCAVMFAAGLELERRS